MGEAFGNRETLSVYFKVEPDFRSDRRSEGLHSLHGLAPQVMTLKEAATDRKKQGTLTLLVISSDDRDARPKTVNQRRRNELTEVADSNAAEEHGSTGTVTMYAIQQSEGAPGSVRIQPFRFLAKSVNRAPDETGSIYSVEIVVGRLRCEPGFVHLKVEHARAKISNYVVQGCTRGKIDRALHVHPQNETFQLFAGECMTDRLSIPWYDLDGSTHPAVLTDGNCLDRRRRPSGFYFDVQHISGVVQPKTIGFWGT